MSATGSVGQSPCRVAIGVTCFNDGPTLNETVDSIRRDPSGVELVIVDDGSNEAATLETLTRLEQAGVRVVHQANQGQAAAATAALRATAADYFMRFDADDLLAPGAITALADALDTAPEAAAAWGDVKTFGTTTFQIPAVAELDPWLVTYTNCITGSGTLYRRTALLEVGGWQLREGFEDWDVWMALAELGYEGVRVPRVVFHYRRGVGRRLAGWLDDTEHHYEVLRRRHPALFAARTQNRRRSNCSAAIKVGVLLVEAIPGLSRLSKIHGCELLVRLGIGETAAVVRMLWGAIVLRVGGSRR